jgi:hypothetical protein
MCDCLGGFAVRCCFTIVVLAALSVFDGRSIVQAQYNSALNYSGMSSGAVSGRQGMFGNRSTGSSSRPGQGNLAAGNAFGSQGGLSSARFVRGNRQAGDFVGGSAEDIQQHFVGGVQGDMNMGGWQQQGGAMSPWVPGSGYPNPRQNANRNQQAGGATAGQNTTSIRTSFHPDFNYPQPNSNRLSTSLTRRLAETPAIQPVTPIRVEVQGRTAILQGVVSTEHDRELAEQMIRLEPGIEAVRNEIAVENPMPGDSTPP